MKFVVIVVLFLIAVGLMQSTSIHEGFTHVLGKDVSSFTYQELIQVFSRTIEDSPSSSLKDLNISRIQYMKRCLHEMLSYVEKSYRNVPNAHHGLDLAESLGKDIISTCEHIIQQVFPCKDRATLEKTTHELQAKIEGEIKQANENWNRAWAKQPNHTISPRNTSSVQPYDPDDDMHL